MGLDQFAYSVDKSGEREEIAYWRKHNRLQGWMEQRYVHKGGMGEFNCVDVEIDEDDLDLLEQTIKNKSLPQTGGFFFGNDSYADYEDEYGYKEADIEFLEKARKILESGNRVVYSCWW
jgi:hypothetical protein